MTKKCLNNMDGECMANGFRQCTYCRTDEHTCPDFLKLPEIHYKKERVLNPDWAEFMESLNRGL